MTIDEETSQERGIDPLLALAEASFGALSSLLGLVPLHVDQTNIEHARSVQTLQQSLNQMAQIAVALGSKALKPQEPSTGSGIILPK